MAASTIPAAKAALRTAILARPALTALRFEWGQPADLPSDAEWLVLGDALEVTRVYVAFGQFQENYLLQVRVNAVDAGGTNESAELRLWALVAEVEAAVVADMFLAGTVADIRPSSVVPRTGPYDGGWWAEADVMFACIAFGSP